MPPLMGHPSIYCLYIGGFEVTYVHNYCPMPPSTASSRLLKLVACEPTIWHLALRSSLKCPRQGNTGFFCAPCNRHPASPPSFRLPLCMCILLPRCPAAPPPPRIWANDILPFYLVLSKKLRPLRYIYVLRNVTTIHFPFSLTVIHELFGIWILNTSRYARWIPDGEKNTYDSCGSSHGRMRVRTGRASSRRQIHWLGVVARSPCVHPGCPPACLPVRSSNPKPRRRPGSENGYSLSLCMPLSMPAPAAEGMREQHAHSIVSPTGFLGKTC